MKKKAKKAWAIVWSDRGAKEFQVRGHRLITDPMKCTEFKEGSGTFDVYDIFPDKKTAEAFMTISGGDFEIVRCTITY